MGGTVTAIVCAHNEAPAVAACLHSLLAQTRPPDEIIVVDNASTDGTGQVARRIPGLRVIEEPRKGLVIARQTAWRASSGDVLAFLDADCRAPIGWIEGVLGSFERHPAIVGVTGPYRFYDWDWSGRTLLWLYDVLVAPPTHLLVHRMLGIGAVLYGGNFAVRRDALEQIGGFDTSIEFHGEDTNLGRRLTPLGVVRVARSCWMWTSARRYKAMGKSVVFGLYVRNFWSEILRHRPSDTQHLDVRT